MGSPGIEPATQFIINEDYALNYLYIALSVSTYLMIGMIVFISARFTSNLNSHLPSQVR